MVKLHESVGPGAESTRSLTAQAKNTRKEKTNSLRKQKRSSNLAKRRKRGVEEDTAYTGTQVGESVALLKSAGLGKRVEALKAVRRVLSGDGQNIAMVLQSGTFPLLLESLIGGASEEKLEAAWCITNIASGSSEETAAIAPAITQLIHNLSSPSSALQEQCLWALANVAGEREVGLGEQLFQSGVLQPMIVCMASSNEAVAQCAAWALTNLLRGRRERFDEALADFSTASLKHTLARIFTHGTKTEPLCLEILWLLTYLTNSDDTINTQLLALGLLRYVCMCVRLVWESKYTNEILIPAIRIVGNISSAGPAGVAAVYQDAEVARAVFSGLDCPRRVVVKEACWALSNLTAGTDEEIQGLLAIDGLVPTLVNVLTNADFTTRVQAAYCLANLCANGRHIALVVRSGALGGYLPLLRAPDPEAAHVSLAFVEMVLELMPGGVELIEEMDGVEAIEELLVNDNFSLRASRIMDKYYNWEAEDAAEAGKAAPTSFDFATGVNAMPVPTEQYSFTM